jgi:hypothetical protein
MCVWREAVRCTCLWAVLAIGSAHRIAINVHEECQAWAREGHCVDNARCVNGSLCVCMYAYELYVCVQICHVRVSKLCSSFCPSACACACVESAMSNASVYAERTHTPDSC